MSRLSEQGLTRRALMSRAVAAGALAVAGAGFIAAPDAAWAVEVTAISEHEMATLLQMARDIYPHDRVGDRFYAIAVKAYDSEEQKALVAEGVAALDAAARAAGFDSYLAAGWEAERVEILRRIEDTAFFQAVRGGLVTGLYNQKEVWPIFGYEGESFSEGGYIDRGFDDIDWL
ncbi:Twin-arginine translocation pathway signal [Paracoccus siganidrum]|uniref:Twin-arginine translocation pathway signal n=1 Tax=Paracoccus siganidrum TaxID=1276757 RepID=A0A419A3W5_9RHOB|nr:Twin-arginine translocation pathway signal [Paracoccus siganidrum]RJL08610.1 Twin-arginine translocation pathway signal [Paracoccus siganidrum]RMC27334.1 Twin-arginine translocation pathway signal [Paracoccus siganidrum]